MSVQVRFDATAIGELVQGPCTVLLGLDAATIWTASMADAVVLPYAWVARRAVATVDRGATVSLQGLVRGRFFELRIAAATLREDRAILDRWSGVRAA